MSTGRNEILFRDVLENDYGKTATERDITPGDAVELFVSNIGTNKKDLVGTAQVHSDGNNNFQTVLHGHQIEENMIILRSFVCHPEKSDPQNIPYPYTFRTTDDVPQTIQALNSIFFVWDSRAMVSLTRTKSTSNPPPENNDVIEITDDMEIDEVVEVEVDVEDDSKGKEFTHKQFKRNEYETVTVQATIDQIQDFNHPLRPVDVNHVTELEKMFSDEEVGYDQSAGTMSITILEQDLTDGILRHAALDQDPTKKAYRLKENQTATIVDGRHRRQAILNQTNLEIILTGLDNG